jgi:hypothetical protein
VHPSLRLHLRLISSPSCLGFNSLQQLNLNILRPPYSKFENDPEDAIQKNKLVSLAIGRRGLASNLRPKPINHPKLSSIAEGLEHATFGDIPEVEL